MLRRWWTKLRNLWRLAWTERTTPRELGLALALGALIGSTPVIGFHGLIAMALATLLRLNRLIAFLGSRLSTPFVLPFIVLAEIELAHRVRCGEFVHLTTHDVLAHAHGLLLDWCLGTIPVGLALATIAGLLGYGLGWLRLKRKLARDRRSSSGCPLSGSEPRLS